MPPPIHILEPLELLSSNNDDGKSKPLLPIKNKIHVLYVSESCHVGIHSVVSTLLMESLCSSIGIVEQVPNTPSTQAPCLAFTLLRNESLVICIYNLIVVWETRKCKERLQGYKSNILPTPTCEVSSINV